mmetsp:Transcript_29478/g.69990  ORF Transcript_29478/g.69990 Transcript_29478/m.69990 type:complete len:251 (+) Transcript_29478:229-981(+)
MELRPIPTAGAGLAEGLRAVPRVLPVCAAGYADVLRRHALPAARRVLQLHATHGRHEELLVRARAAPQRVGDGVGEPIAHPPRVKRRLCVEVLVGHGQPPGQRRPRYRQLRVLGVSAHDGQVGRLQLVGRLRHQEVDVLCIRRGVVPPEEARPRPRQVDVVLQVPHERAAIAARGTLAPHHPERHHPEAHVQAARHIRRAVERHVVPEGPLHLLPRELAAACPSRHVQRAVKRLVCVCALVEQLEPIGWG